ncbi:hypothetical protein HDU98_007408 [Podochytrium sp. JEL0797]|nr:hypothetical protein HDU98_007408 [Podochytrium sp. JEL0797]
MAFFLLDPLIRGFSGDMLLGIAEPVANATLPQCEDIFAGDATLPLCSYALAHCGATGASVNYMALYVCVFGAAPSLGMVALGLLLLSCFVSIAAVAGGFLCANLSAMAALLQLGETVAGVTLAALGNGAPDIFATYSAVRSGAGSMVLEELMQDALGELLGAALFVTLIVVGAVAVISEDTDLPKRPFVRDMLFLIGCVCIIIYIVHVGEISFLLSIMFILYYLVYVLAVVLGHIFNKHSHTSGGGGHGAVIDVHDIDAIDEPHIEARDSLGQIILDDDHPTDEPFNDFYDIDNANQYSTATANLRVLTTGRTFVPHLNKELFPFLAAYSQPDNDGDEQEYELVDRPETATSTGLQSASFTNSLPNSTNLDRSSGP